MATVIRVDGSTEEVEPANGTDFSLKELQDIVEGYIETVSLKDGRLMVINEEGRIYDLPRNEQATRIAELPTIAERQAYLESMAAKGVSVIDATMGEEDYIAGNVLVCKSEEIL